MLGAVPPPGSCVNAVTVTGTTAATNPSAEAVTVPVQLPEIPVAFTLTVRLAGVVPDDGDTVRKFAQVAAETVTVKFEFPSVLTIAIVADGAGPLGPPPPPGLVPKFAAVSNSDEGLATRA